MSGGAGGRIAGGIAAGAAAIGILSQMAGALANAGPSPADLASEAYWQRVDQEKRALQSEAARLNEQARALAAAGDGREEEAFQLFKRAWQTDSSGAGRNSLVYYRNMKMMRARIAYRSALKAYEAGRMTRAAIAFDLAASSALEAQDEALATRIRTQVAELGARAETAAARRGLKAQRQVGNCTTVNGELLCQ